VAVVGASLAGLSAARSLRKQGYDGRLVIVGDEQHRPYDRPPLSKEFLSGGIGEADLALESDDEDLQAEWLLGARATGLDSADRAVRLADGREVRADWSGPTRPWPRCCRRVRRSRACPGRRTSGRTSTA
jgi:NADPH-dependent 2,4-dienoyl-CoA reductase/sulfur reductase-like enzyme